MGKPIKVLLIEDDPGDVYLTQEALDTSRLAIDLQVVEDGNLALDYVYQRGDYTDAERPDLILLDLSLPGCNGEEVLAKIKQDQDLKRIPVVVLTASKLDEDILQSYRLGANCYIPKPVGLDQFLEIIHSLEDFWLTVVKLPKSSG
ncbi:response regulator [Halomicronema hongdechloris]|uniref:response regulator n=1 Tax=Halomicronema hongdechloris TaxID=1209493 RepID=UPI0028F3F91B|nr:response regulator [Halomicronema hongdechloris]